LATQQQQPHLTTGFALQLALQQQPTSQAAGDACPGAFATHHMGGSMHKYVRNSSHITSVLKLHVSLQFYTTKGQAEVAATPHVLALPAFAQNTHIAYNNITRTPRHVTTPDPCTSRL
jgi:hypothetical protein